MSIVNAVPLLAAAGGDYTISRSVRLRSSASAYLSRTFGAPTSGTTWTWSGWIKRGKVSSGYQRFFGHLYVSAPTNNQHYVGFNSDDTLEFEMYTTSAYNARLVTNQVFRDPSAWYHIVAVWNTSDATSSNRLKLYVNGQQITSFSTATYPSQNQTGFINQNGTGVGIGVDYPYNNSYFDGYLTEINFIDGQALTPSSFGENDTVTGVWKPKKYTGTYGTNGFYLNFSDNSNNTAATIGKDYSGNGNNWTPNNISVTAGTTYDSMIDVPTPYADGSTNRGNYAVLNPLRQNGSGTFAQGNLAGTSESGTSHGLCSTIVLPRSDKWYMEWTPSSSTTNWFGVTANDILAADINTAGQQSVLYYASNGNKYVNGTGSAYGASYTTETIGIAFDGPGGTITFYKNNVSQGAITLPSSTVDYVFCMGNAGGGGVTNYANFGQRPFAYTPPSGFKALNTQNLPEPTIKKGNQYFDATTYTGNGATGQTITNAGGFQPDLVWVKSRSNAYDNGIQDAVRGTTKDLNSNNTDAEETRASSITAFTSSGFTLGGNDLIYNGSGATYVGWQWKKGATQGFDIVTYTGTGANRTVAHSLGVAPSMLIFKPRNAADNWPVWHKSFAVNEYVYLNLTNAKASLSTFMNSTLPDSSNITLGTWANTNANTQTMVCYAFSEVAGFSRMGSYQGNGSSDGPFVFCNFRPRWVMVKRTDTTSDWTIWDTARDTYNVSVNRLFPNLSSAESTGVNFDITSNGFKLRDTGAAVNASGGTYIFAAFSETAFKFSLAR